MKRVVDLSHLIEFEMPRAPGFPDIEKSWLMKIGEGSHVNVERVTTALHIGTHMDAPYHFFPEKKTVDELPADCLLGPAVVVDLRHKQGHAGITAADLREWEQKTGVSIETGDAVLLMTNHYRLWRIGERDSAFLRTWPYLCEDGAEYLKDKGVRMVCTEASDIDDVDKPLGPSHRVLLGNGILVVENVCNVDAIQAARCELIAAPLKIKGGSGSPLRLLAVVEGGEA